MEQNTINSPMNAQLPQWGIAEIWNAALIDRDERALVPRDYLYASELGAPPIDIYLKMKGVEYTNPANARSLRKFEAGNVFEWIVSLVLRRSGIVKDTQVRCEYQYDDMLSVHGKADFIAGGQVNIDEAYKFIDFLKQTDMPDVFLRCFDRIVTYLQEKYPSGIAEMPIEVKSVSSFAMDKMEKSKAPIARHRLQLFHYMKSQAYPRALILYLCRDDLRMMEFEVTNPSYVEQEYIAAIAQISAFVKADKEPPKERLIMFDDEYGKFSKNLGVEWSPYLTKLYGFQEPREYSEIYGKQATNWNRVMRRVKEGKKMTDKNEIVLNEIRAAGYDVEDITNRFKMEAVEEEETV